MSGSSIHALHAFTYANAGARTGATGLTASDVGKDALQSDTKTFWRLTNHDPVTWVQLGGGSGGGGGGEWRAGLSVVAPDEDIEFDAKVFKYSSGDAGAQALFRKYKVPSSYAPGTQIKLAVDFYGEATSAVTLLLLAQATLIRSGTDAANTTTNQRTTTNTAVAQDATQYKVRQALLDLTDTSGQINGVAVSAGDEILVKLYRGADTDAGDLRFIPDSSDCRFA
jgi:hypothetical protein